MAKISKKQLEKARMKWLVKVHIDLLKGWYSELYGENIELEPTLSKTGRCPEYIE